MIIIAMEETTFLLAVDAIVGRVEVEDQVLRRGGVGGDELIDQDLGDLDQCLSIDAVLQTAESRRRGEGLIRLGQFAGGDLEGQVIAEGLMVVEILVSQGQRRDPLGDHGALVMDDEHGMTRIWDRRVKGVEESDAVIDLAEQEGPGICGNLSTQEVGDDGLGVEPGKSQRIAVTVCHSGGLALGGGGLVLNPYPTRSKAIAPYRLANLV